MRFAQRALRVTRMLASIVLQRRGAYLVEFHVQRRPHIWVDMWRDVHGGECVILHSPVFVLAGHIEG